MDHEDARYQTESPSRPPLGSSLPPAVVGGSIGAGLVAALFVWVLTEPEHGSEHPKPPVVAAAPEKAPVKAPAVVQSIERQTAVHRLAGWRGEPLAPFDAEAAMPTTLTAPLAVTPPFDTIDAILFDAADTRYRLSGVLPVGRDEVCLDGEQRRFACGLQARASLQNFIRNKTLQCRVAVGSGEGRDGIVDVDCTVDGASLALHQVAAGFAFPARDEPGPLATAMAAARAKHLGVWIGDYQIPATDRSEADSRAYRSAAARAAAAPRETPQPTPAPYETPLPQPAPPRSNAKK